MLKAIFSLLLFLFISTHGRQGSYSVPDSGEPICSDGNIMIQSGESHFVQSKAKKESNHITASATKNYVLA